jgi:hypothetical protein
VLNFLYKKLLYPSIKSQLLEILARYVEQPEDEIIIFNVSEDEELLVLRQVVANMYADMYKEGKNDIHLQVFVADNDDSASGCIITKHKLFTQGKSCVWLKKSKISDNWLVMASPPGAINFYCLSVWKDRTVAEAQATELLNEIKTFPFEEWDKKYKSVVFLNLLQNLPPDDNSYVGFLNQDKGKKGLFDLTTKDTFNNLIKKAQLATAEQEKEMYYQRVQQLLNNIMNESSE